MLFSLQSHTIRCEGGRNENGRTPTARYRIVNGKVARRLLGEIADSEDDYRRMRSFNGHMEEVRRSFIIKNANSNRSAAHCIITC